MDVEARKKLTWCDTITYTSSDMSFQNGSGTIHSGSRLQVLTDQSKALFAFHCHIAISNVNPDNNAVGIKVNNNNFIPKVFGDFEVGFWMWSNQMKAWDALLLNGNLNNIFIRNRNYTGTITGNGTSYFVMYAPWTILPL